MPRLSWLTYLYRFVLLPIPVLCRTLFRRNSPASDPAFITLTPRCCQVGRPPSLRNAVKHAVRLLTLALQDCRPVAAGECLFEMLAVLRKRRQYAVLEFLIRVAVWSQGLVGHYVRLRLAFLIPMKTVQMCAGMKSAASCSQLPLARDWDLAAAELSEHSLQNML
jgi:hypothetical protein